MTKQTTTFVHYIMTVAKRFQIAKMSIEKKFIIELWLNENIYETFVLSVKEL